MASANASAASLSSFAFLNFRSFNALFVASIAKFLRNNTFLAYPLLTSTTSSFVLTGVHERVYISARSIDEVNVQKIMEEFGGGGHLTVAGAQLVDVSLEEAKNIIHETLRYLISKGEI